MVTIIAVNRGLDATNDFTASAACLKPVAIDFNIPVIPLPDFFIPSLVFITFSPDFSKLLVDALTDVNSACACLLSTSIFMVFLSGIELISDFKVSICAISLVSAKSENAFLRPSRLFMASSIAEKPCMVAINNVTC